MKKALANLANSFTTQVAKQMAKTGCILVCHRPEAPDELFSK